MAAKVSFEQLLQAASGEDLGKAKDRQKVLDKKRTDLQTELAKLQAEFREVEAQLNAPIRSAVKAARELGIEVPEEYQQAVRGSGNGGRSSGKYEWTANGTMARREEVSRAMWRLSRGSGGSGGKNDEGILLADEFWALVKEQTGKVEAELKLGEKVEVALPNGRKVTMQKVED